MNLKNLGQLSPQRPLKQRVETLPKSVRRSAPDPYRQGLRYLLEARRQNFAQREWLSRAFDCFKTAQMNHPKDPRVYLALAYLSILAQELVRARLCLQQAQVCLNMLQAPDSELTSLQADLERLQDFLHQQASVEPARTQVDCDALLAQTERLIADQVYLHSQRSLPPVASLDPAQTQRCQSELQTLNRVCDQIKAQLAILDSELDTAHLQRALRPLELLLKRYQETLALRQEIDSLIERIGQHLGTAVKALNCGQCTEQILCAEHRDCERELDACDSIAERLERLDAQGYLFPELLARYEQWAAVLNDWCEGC